MIRIAKMFSALCSRCLKFKSIMEEVSALKIYTVLIQSSNFIILNLVLFNFVILQIELFCHSETS